MWKKLIPINLYADPVDMEHPKWLIKIIGHSQFVDQKELEDLLNQNVLLNEDNLVGKDQIVTECNKGTKHALSTDQFCYKTQVAVICAI